MSQHDFTALSASKAAPDRSLCKRACRTLSGAALLLLPFAAGGQGDNSPVALRLKFKPGEVSKYQTNAQFVISLPMQSKPTPGSRSGNAATVPSQLSMVQQVKVNKVLPNGDGELSITTLSTQSSMGGQPGGISTTPSKPIVMTYSPHGNAVAVHNAPSGGVAGEFMFSSLLGSGAVNMSGLYLPTNPVKPGDTWTQKVTLPSMANSATIKATFQKVETVGRYRTAHIHTLLSMPVNAMLDINLKPTRQAAKAQSTANGTVSMTFDTNFAIAEGKVIRSAGNGNASLSIHMRQPASKPANGKPGAARPDPLPQALNLTVKTTIGTNLIE
jgi:hypothetical protein